MTLMMQDQMMTKMVCTGVVTAMCVSPSGHYCAAAIQDKLHIWQVGGTADLCYIFIRRSKESVYFHKTAGLILGHW